MAIHGRFIPKNPQKYIGDAEKIFFRSLWEAKVMEYFDSRPDVISWESEEDSVPYFSPVDLKVHRYFPDFIVTYYDINKNIIKEMVEVKPLHEADAAFAKSDRSKDALVINEAKWKAASLYCEERGMIFHVLTEKSIFHQGPKRVPKIKKTKNARTISV